MVNKADKLALLKKILSESNGSTLVFSRTKHGAKKITKMIRNFGYPAAEIHSNRSLNQRLEALQGFKLGKYRVLVATDIAARGIDVNNIELVINYDLPEQAADYVHRIGRTARAGKSGHAISFATSDQHSDVRAIERLIKKTLPTSRAAGMPEIPAAERELSESRPNRDFQRSRHGNGGRGRRDMHRTPRHESQRHESRSEHSGPAFGRSNRRKPFRKFEPHTPKRNFPKDRGIDF